jgi:2-dehydropantoate 2-reductase
MKILVLGSGGVGLCYGGQLARAGHDVTCFARGANLAALRDYGLEVRLPADTFRVRVHATDSSRELSAADFAILAVKSYSLPEIADVVRHCAALGTAVLPLLNGVETADRLRALGVPANAIVGGLTTVSAVRVAPGVVERRSPFQSVVIGEYDGRPSERTQAIAHAFRESGIDARVSDQIEVNLWQKFVFIAALAASCGLARSAVGPLRADPLGRRLLQRATQEVLAVAAARGVALPEGEAVRVLSVIDGLPPAMKPSFLLDLESGGPTELDALCGTVSRFAEQAGLAVPIHDTATFVLGRQPSTPQAG